MIQQRVLFLCTGNSCRSQMAEGLVNHYLAGHWRADSAGTEPAGYVHPLAITVMAELGIDLSRGVSKHVETLRGVTYDRVITVCDDAAENCPVWFGPGLVTHISFPDPAKATGTDAERLAVFRQVRDDIRQQILTFLQEEAVRVDG